jgi:hypothetical protein
MLGLNPAKHHHTTPYDQTVIVHALPVYFAKDFLHLEARQLLEKELCFSSNGSDY